MSWIGILVIFLAFFAFRGSALRGGRRRWHEVDTEVRDALENLTEEVRRLRDEQTDLAERLDFTERMLADVRRREALPGPGA